MGHESRIEPWLPMTTVLLVSFRTDWLRREDTMKTAWKETGNRWAAVFSIRMDGAAGQNRTCSSTWGWKQEKFQRWGKCFLLTSPSIEHPQYHGTVPSLVCSFPWSRAREPRLPTCIFCLRFCLAPHSIHGVMRAMICGGGLVSSQATLQCSFGFADFTISCLPENANTRVSSLPGSVRTNAPSTWKVKV